MASTMAEKVPITVAYGDGIGPEIMRATLRVLEAAGAQLEIETIDIGERIFQKGFTSGIEPESWESLRRTGVFLKAPVTTPQGGGFKSLNVTVRKTLGLFANVRPCVSYAPVVQTKHPGMNLVIVRENEEDLYAGIEHRQTDDVYQTLKLVTRPGSEKLIRYAFAYAIQNKRKKVTCFSKDNIMKLTDGLFHKVYDEVSADYPQIETEHMIVDIGAARLADTPEAFDVIVMPNLYGDILSDVAAQITGSVGLGGSANIGERIAMFEAIHGSAPAIAGQGIANPSGILLASVMMLVHVGQPLIAEKIHNAWLCTIEDGIHTPDIYRRELSKLQVGTDQFADALIERLGEQPTRLAPVHYDPHGVRLAVPPIRPRVRALKELVGVDLFIHWSETDANQLAATLQLAKSPLTLRMITNRGVKVWPGGMPETFHSDHWRCRFKAPQDVQATPIDIVELLRAVYDLGLDSIKTENLYNFDGEPGYSLGQGE